MKQANFIKHGLRGRREGKEKGEKERGKNGEGVVRRYMEERERYLAQMHCSQ